MMPVLGLFALLIYQTVRRYRAERRLECDDTDYVRLSAVIQAQSNQLRLMMQRHAVIVSHLPAIHSAAMRGDAMTCSLELTAAFEEASKI